MGRLASLKPILGTLPATVAYAPQDKHERDRYRDGQAWRAWYKTRRWQKARWATLVRDLFTCQWPGCGRIESDTSKLVADHKRPHRGDETLFWDDDNRWTLCKPCHDSRKQTAEHAGRL